MEKDEIFINIEPDEQDLMDVFDWLKDDINIRGEGFYNNKDIIVDSFEKGTLITFKKGNENIGLVTWSETDIILIDIDIFVIHPSYRGLGYGTIYYNAISDFFRNKGFKVVKLFCYPYISEGFWKKMGLIKFPNCGYTEHELTYYGVLVNTASTAYISNMDKIELWDVEPYEAEEKNPRWTWYVEKQKDMLLYPIIQPCNCNWNLRWSRNGIVLKEGKVKYFTDEDYELYHSKFLYIYQLYDMEDE